MTAKPATAFPEFFHNIAILSYVSSTNYSLNRLNLWLLFFRWFPHCKSAAYCKKNNRLNYSKKFGIFSYFCVLDIINFPFNLKHTKTNENINLWKRTEAEAGVGAMREGELRNRSLTHEDQVSLCAICVSVKSV